MSIAWQDNNDSNNNTNDQTQHFSLDFQVNQKIKAAVSGRGLHPFIKRYFFEFASDRDKEQVADFILSCIRQENIAANTRRSTIVMIVRTFLGTGVIVMHHTLHYGLFDITISNLCGLPTDPCPARVMDSITKPLPLRLSTTFQIHLFDTPP